MDLPDTSNETDKSWDHPWTTDEMREHRNDWSLAADAGLLKHLEQFSNNLTETINKTQEKFNSLKNDLSETSIIVDNITNASLALANTQFIESRVHEDDIETKPPRITEGQKINDEELDKEDLIACVSESIKHGLSIMDEKFERLEVLASDSEDDGEIPTPSIVLKPKDPYQNRPLPYVIGSEKWKSSSRVGLESSSSDSEPPEGESESASEDDEKMPQRATGVNNRRESMLRRSSSSSSISTDRNELGGIAKNYSGVSSRTDKLDAQSQDTLNSGSEIATPIVGPTRAENSSKEAPSFAEELAKRLGKVLPSSTTPVTDTHEADQSSINRFKDDLFAPGDGDVFGSQSDNLFSDNNNLFDAEVSSSLWKDKPIRVSKSTIIPPSFDVPPPMHEVEKPKSAFDDLCGDADSEDSDDIFASKSSVKTAASKSTYPSDDYRERGDFRENKFLKIAQSENIGNMATSTPETNDNGGLFGDESDDDDDELFGSSVKSRNRITERSPEVARAATRPKPPGLSITQADLLSSNLGSRLFQRVPRQNSSDSSDTDAAKNNEHTQVSEPTIPDSNENLGASTQNIGSLILAGNGNGSRVIVENSSASSGISIQPNSTNNTFGVSLGVDFQPQLESTRLKSEDLYRERVSSDSLFAGRIRQQDNTGSIINNSSNRPHDGRIAEALGSHQEEDFDSDDVFGPPPLPKADSKTKSDTSSVDDLFSNASSGSRSRKSSDLLASTEPQYGEKSTSGRSRGLFDEDIDIFGTGDVPDVDIFGAGFASNLAVKETKPPSLEIDRNTSDTSAKKSTDLFSASIADSGDFGGQRKAPTKSDRKPNSIFDDSEEEDDDDLFGSSFLKSDRKIVAMLKSDDDNLFASKPKSSVETVPTETKKDFTSAEAERRVADGANNSLTKLDDKRDSDEAAVESPVPSYPSGGLFDNLDGDVDDDDSLFVSKKTDKSKEITTSTKVEEKSTMKSEASYESKTVDSKFKTNCAKIEGLLKDQSAGETDVMKSSEKEDRPSMKPPVSIKSPGLLARRHDNDNSSRKTASEAEKEDEVSTTDGAKISKARSSTEAIGEITKREPPKTLSIRLPIPSAGDDSAQAPRRAVSSKIKNLMGKMGDLEKILSPTDTPPLWRKAEEKSDDEPTNSRDSEDGSAVSVPSTKSPTMVPSKAEDLNIFPEVSKEEVPSSPQDDSGNSETAVSFDVPAQVETLAVTASKSRARIQAKRRPQSRHARHSALRKSGIDFDAVDAGPEAVESDPSDNTFSSISDKIPTVITDSIDSPKESFGSDRLTAPDVDAESRSADKLAESSSSLAPDDRSELSFSKGSSMSINKNTLLSPSTDEEDLFDVPPDLPEDPPKEDTLFGRAPILSPIDGLLGSKHTRSKQRSKDNRGAFGASENTLTVDRDSKSTKNEKAWKETAKEKNSREADIGGSEGESKSNDGDKIQPTDPLRDSSHDPLKDPSQLFAFVTKTPSPEKGQNLLFKEDDSLFTRLAKKSAEEAKAASKKSTLELFADDSSGDLFSGSLAKASKKSTAASKNNSLFDDIDTDEDGSSDLFGSVARAKATREKIEVIEDTIASKSSETSGRASPSRGSIFGEDADDDLFVDALDKKFSPEPEKSSTEVGEDRLFPATSKIAKDAKLKDIFGEQSSGEEDIFATKKIIGKSRATSSIFTADGDDDDVDDIFGTKSSTKGTTVETIESRNTPKKPVTRDLKKTAEKIVGDPLSMLQDD